MSSITFTFSGKSCTEFGIVAFDAGTYGADANEYEVIRVPGRNGDLLISNNRYPNRAHSYNCIIYENAVENYRNFRAWLMSQIGYKRLIDSRYPNEYLQAYVASSLDPELTPEEGLIKFKLTFMRNPKRYLSSGYVGVVFTQTGTITNPTLYAALPTLIITGTGVVGINDTNITIKRNPGRLGISCELGRCYDFASGAGGWDDAIELSTIDFPKLNPGNNAVALGTGITRVELIPQWWTI